LGEDVADGRRAGDGRAAARPRRELRAADRAQAWPLLRRLRRADPRPVRGRDDNPRDPAAPARAVRRRRLGRADQRGDRVDPGRRQAWQSRPLEELYVAVYLDAMQVAIRDQQVVRKKAVYVAIGVTLDGERDCLGLWIEKTE